MYIIPIDPKTNQPSTHYISRDTDKAHIPLNNENTDYQQFKKDLANGAELKDANGTAMTSQQITAFLATLA